MNTTSKGCRVRELYTRGDLILLNLFSLINSIEHFEHHHSLNLLSLKNSIEHLEHPLILQIHNFGVFLSMSWRDRNTRSPFKFFVSKNHFSLLRHGTCLSKGKRRLNASIIYWSLWISMLSWCALVHTVHA